MAKATIKATSAEPATVPEGMDPAIWREGNMAKENAPNPFTEGTPQFDTWAAGYAARPEPEAEPGSGDEDLTFR
jgi:hypothetical protein